MARLSEHGIRLSCMSPSYLHSNSTSHTWPFSAVAELIDNACDPGVTAKQICIDVESLKDQLCITFTDNGSGMTPSKLHKMLSFGFTDKGSNKTHQPIGVYGNGFKSGSMRLGKDALIFTKNGGCLSVGLLSQTYLESIKAQAVIVPIVPFNQQNKNPIVTEDSVASLKAILSHSLFSSQEDLLQQFDSIPTKKGTRIVIWNIRRNKDGKPELDFETDKYDIRMPDLRPEETGAGAKKRFPGPMRTDHCVPEMDYSLRAYCSILYLKPRTQIILRQRKVQSKLVAKSLANIENDVYKPSFINKRVKITFGFNCKNREHCGIMMYHKNRLIKSYEKVGCQIKSTSRGAGVGVIGVIECNFLKPAHNKQDFEYTKEYRLTLAALGMKLNDYWREKKEKKAKEKAARAKAKKEKQLAEEEEEEEEEEDEEEEEEEIDPDQRWVQCEECLKWRKMPVWMSPQSLPERWNCSLHPDPRSRSCLVPEDPEESEDELTPSYEKTFKKQDPTWDRKRSRSLEEAKRRPGLARGMSEPSNHSTGKVKEKEEEEQTSEYSAPCGEEDLQAVCSNKRKAPWRQCSADKKLCAGLESPALSHPRAKCEEEKEEEREEEKEEEEEEEEEEGGQVEEDGYEEEDEEEDDGEENPIEVTVKQEHRRTPPMTGSSQKPLASPTAPAPSPGKRELRRPAPPLSICAEGMDRVTLCQRVAQLEREADRLRGILGTPPLPRSPLAEPGPSPSPSSSPSLEHITDLYQQVTQERELLSQGLTEAAEKLVVMSAERDKYKLKVMELQQERTRLQEECEKSQQEVLLLRTPPSGAGEDIYWGKKYANFQYHELETLRSEQERLRMENRELEGQLRQAEISLHHRRDTREQSTSTPHGSADSIALDRLRALRQNVVNLLSSVLPHLDLQGISLDTGDIDNILGQVIEANRI